VTVSDYHTHRLKLETVFLKNARNVESGQVLGQTERRIYVTRAGADVPAPTKSQKAYTRIWGGGGELSFRQISILPIFVFIYRFLCLRAGRTYGGTR
jgi:hypothetical protein